MAFLLQAPHRWPGERTQARALSKRAPASQIPGSVPKCPAGRALPRKREQTRSFLGQNGVPSGPLCLDETARSHSQPRAAHLPSRSPLLPRARRVPGPGREGRPGPSLPQRGRRRAGPPAPTPGPLPETLPRVCRSSWCPHHTPCSRTAPTQTPPPEV